MIESKVFNQDCVVGMRSLEEGSVDLVFADPPFNIGYHYDDYQDSLEDGEYLYWCEGWIKEVHRVLKQEGTFWLAIGDAFASELDVLAKRIGFYRRSTVIWSYTFGVNQRKNFTPSHVHIFYYTKHPKRFTFNDKLIRVPSARQAIYGDKRASLLGKVPDDTWYLYPSREIDENGETDTWLCSRVAGTFKERVDGASNQMPEIVLARIIRACSNMEELVLDPFLGTGTTLAVAKKLGRNGIGFEMSEKWSKIAYDRINNTKKGDNILGESVYV